MAAIFAGGVLLLSAIILTITALLTAGPAYQISGTIIGSPADASTLTDCRIQAESSSQAQNGKTLLGVIDPKLGTFTLSLNTEDPTIGATIIDEVALGIVDRLNAQAADRPAIDPAIATQEARLRNLLDECDRQLAAASQPAASQPRGVTDLLVSLQQTLTERQQTAARLSEIAAQLKQPPPSVEQITLTTMPATLPSQEGQLALRRLEADTVALRQRQARLTELLRELLETSLGRLSAAKSAIDENTKEWAAIVPADAEEDIRKQFETIQEAFATWSVSAAGLADSWTSKRNDLQTPNEELDGPACQAGIEIAAKVFLDEGGRARGNIDAALTAIKEGGDEPTKRIILHRNLSQRLQPVLEVMDKAQAAARLAHLNENAQLGATVKTVASLRNRVTDQRNGIQSQLRDQTLQELRAKHDERLIELRLQQDQTQQRASELETTMISGIAEIVGLLAGQESQRSNAARTLQLQQQRGILLEQLVKLKETPTPDRLPPLRYLPAHLTAIISPPGRDFGSTLRLGLGPMLIGFVAMGTVWWLISWRRAQGTLDDLARELKTASRHTEERHSQ